MKRKTKYSIELKEALAQEYLSGASGSKELSVKYGISARYLSRLIRIYEDQGSLSHQDSNNYYGKDFKIRCVISVLKKGLSLSEAARSFGIPSDSTVVKWIKLYREFGEDGLETTKPGRPKRIMAPKRKKKKEESGSEALSLQEELEYLRAENAYLKKLSALIQQEELKASESKPKPSKN